MHPDAILTHDRRARSTFFQKAGSPGSLPAIRSFMHWLAECRYAYSLAVPAKPGEQYTIIGFHISAEISSIRALSSKIGFEVVPCSTVLKIMRRKMPNTK